MSNIEIKKVEYPKRILVLEKATGIPKQRLIKMGSVEIRKLWDEHRKAIEEMAREKVDANIPYSDDPTPDQIKSVIDLMVTYLNKQTKPFGNYYVVKEYPAYPLAIEIVNTNKVHWFGWWGVDRGEAYSKIYWSIKGYYYTLMDVGFEDMDREVGETPDYDYNEPYLWSDRFYSSDSIEYEITPIELEGVYTLNLILDGSYLLSPITQSDIDKTLVVSVSLKTL
jgi:hypothetical protein